MRGRLFSSTTGDLFTFFETTRAESDLLAWEGGPSINGAGTGAGTGIAAATAGVGEIFVVALGGGGGGGGKSSSFGTFLALVDFPCASLTWIQIFQHSSAIYKIVVTLSHEIQNMITHIRQETWTIKRAAIIQHEANIRFKSFNRLIFIDQFADFGQIHWSRNRLEIQLFRFLFNDLIDSLRVGGWVSEG